MTADREQTRRDALIAKVADRLRFNERAYGKTWTGEDEDAEFIVQDVLAELEQAEQRIKELETSQRDEPPEGYIIPEGDERCGYTMDACQCMKRDGHEGLHGCAHGGWR